MAKKCRSKAVPAEDIKTETAAPAAEDNVKETEPVITVKIQYGGNEYSLGDIKEKAVKESAANVAEELKTIDLYIKPEDNTVYYVVNSEYRGQTEL